MSDKRNRTSAELNIKKKKRRPTSKRRRSLLYKDIKGPVKNKNRKKRKVAATRRTSPLTGASKLIKALLNGKSSRKLIIGAGVLLAVAIVGILLLVFNNISSSRSGLSAEIEAISEAEQKLTEEQLEMEADKRLREQRAAEARARLDEKKAMEDAWESMWISEVELPSENTSDFAVLESCLISEEDSSKVVVTGTIPGIPNADNKDLYLFALNTFDTGIAEGSSPVASYRIDRTSEKYKLTTNLNFKSASSLLYKKFVVAVKKNDQYVMITKTGYITNPEQKAAYNSYKVPASKKGVIVDASRLNNGEIDDLGIKQGAYNIWVGRLLNTSSGAISYDYNGKTYYFNKSDVGSYDIIFGTLSAKGIQCTAVVLNDPNGAHPEMIHPNARGGSCPYYMFNGATQDGVETLAAVASFLADRYSGNHGTVSNWIFANEINARKEWNYYENTDVNSYAAAYAQAFRVFYTGIKSTNGSAKVYMPLDQTWNRNIDGKSGDYDARDVLDAFNSIIKEKGNIDWDLAYHPYAVPLTKVDFWNGYKNLVVNSTDTPMVSMKNINIVTSYLCNDTFKKRDGSTRQVLLSEQGYTSTKGEALQAAAIAYSYKIAAANPNVNGFILNRQIDAPAEVAQGLALGLLNSGGGHKQSYDVYKYIDTSEANAHADFAKSIIGISDW